MICVMCLCVCVCMCVCDTHECLAFEQSVELRSPPDPGGYWGKGVQSRRCMVSGMWLPQGLHKHTHTHIKTSALCTCCLQSHTNLREIYIIYLHLILSPNSSIWCRLFLHGSATNQLSPSGIVDTSAETAAVFISIGMLLDMFYLWQGQLSHSRGPERFSSTVWCSE